MPIGNGDTAALVFPLARGISSGPSFSLGPGVHVWLNMQTAMASDQSLMPLGQFHKYPKISHPVLFPPLQFSFLPNVSVYTNDI